MEFIPGSPMLSINTTYTTNPNELMAICFKDFLITDFSQTTNLRGEICSLKYILSNYSDNFENVLVIVDMEDGESTVSYTINIAGYQNSIQYVLSQVISESNKEILNYDEIIHDFRKDIRRA